MGIDNEATGNVGRAVRIGKFWYAPEPGERPEGLAYRAAVLIDCMINFRSLKAGINNSEERSYTAWLSEGTLPVNWDAPAVKAFENSRLTDHPDPSIPEPSVKRSLDAEHLGEIETDLIEALIRRERLVLLRNPRFQIFSDMRESRGEFLDRVAEVALQEIEPELKQLKQVFELRLEQVREAHITRRGLVLPDLGNAGAAEGKAEIERLLHKRTEFFEAGNRIASLFTGLAGSVLQMPRLEPQEAGEAAPEAALELREDLQRVQQEASEALTEVYTRYLEMVRSIDEFEIRIQPSNLRVLRRALLLVPTV